MNTQHGNEFMLKNRRDILQRLMWVRAKDDGIILHHQDEQEEFIVVKKDTLIMLHFVGEADEQGEKPISDVMSFIDISNPLFLHSNYAQAMLVSLALLGSSPKRMYMLGFGGGRIPMFLHHYFPQLQIESSELSEGVASTLEMFFGIKQDERMNITIGDGRRHLQEFPDAHFDLLFLDTFSGAGDHPNELSTAEFYKLCQSKITENGVVATNLVDNNAFFAQKAETFCQAFKYSYTYSFSENHVCMGSDTVDVSTSDLVSKSENLDQACNFHFKLAERAESFRPLSCDSNIVPLTDEALQSS